MPAAEIKALRQDGKLEAALSMAQEELNANPENIWGKRNISWVYYEYLKKFVQEYNYEAFIENLIRIKDLNLPEEEVMIFDTSAYQIGSMLFKVQGSEPIDYSKINQIFDVIKYFHFTKPSESYSFLIKAFQKGSQNWSRFIEFVNWWGLEHFGAKDFQTEEYNDRQMAALADKVYGSYCKKLIDGEPQDAFGTVKKVDVEKINAFLPKLETVIEKHPEFQYLPYYKAQMLLHLGNEEDVLTAFLPFAKQKRNDFWVWGLMAEIFKDHRDIEFACYCKALSLKTPNDFLVKTRQAFAKLLIERNLYREAKTEIKNIISVRESKGWRIPNEIIQFTESDWYKSSEALPNNRRLYDDNISKAEELLYRDLPEHIVVVEFINHDKKILNFIENKNFHGFFNYDNFIEKANIGDVLKVRLETIGNEGFYRALTIVKIEDSSKKNVPSLKEVSGIIRIPEGKSFGFLEDIFLPPNLIEASKLVDGQSVSTKAILSYNKSKNEWGWKAFQILKS